MFKTIIREHNEEGFSPASTIHKNILSFIVKINNFETIVPIIEIRYNIYISTEWLRCVFSDL